MKAPIAGPFGEVGGRVKNWQRVDLPSTDSHVTGYSL